MIRNLIDHEKVVTKQDSPFLGVRIITHNRTGAKTRFMEVIKEIGAELVSAS